MDDLNALFKAAAHMQNVLCVLKAVNAWQKIKKNSVAHFRNSLPGCTKNFNNMEVPDF